MKRRLAAILVGDVAGYSAMMEADEEERLLACLFPARKATLLNPVQALRAE